ncbi:MAG: hypothetical protein KAI86_15205 [Desulfobacterales bacterium]|nr:hypothetical protein [Desulfobacterales bacterium]
MIFTVLKKSSKFYALFWGFLWAALLVLFINLDFSTHNEGPITIWAVQESIRSASITGAYDATPPRVFAAEIDENSISIRFNESNLKNAFREKNYRFSPSLNFKTPGGVDDIVQIGDFTYQLALKSVPQHEIIRLSMSGITDRAGNAIDPAPVFINDGDRDHMADDWEAENGLDILIADALPDHDGDGFSNLQEYQARSNPFKVLSAPIEIRDSIPQEDAGIVNAARVPDETGFAVLIRSVHGIDLNSADAIRFTIDDGFHVPYIRDLRFDTVRVVKLIDEQDDRATFLWAVYDRLLEPYMPSNYQHNFHIYIKIEIRDVADNILQPAAFEFKIESAAQRAASRQNRPKTEEIYAVDPDSGGSHDAGIQVVEGELAGARVMYNSNEPLTPQFGSQGEIEKVNIEGLEAVGMPVNLAPHTVFDTPVKLFVPVPEDADILSVGLAYHDGTQWLPAADAEGNVLPGGEGWMVPGSRVNHTESSPALIEVQVYHFSGTQTVVFASSDGTREEEDRPPGESRSGAVVFVSCFVDSVSPDSRSASWPLSLIVGMIILMCGLRFFIRQDNWNSE